MKELPTADDFFNSTQTHGTGQLPTADQFFASPEPSNLDLANSATSSIITGKGISNPAVDKFMQKTAAGRIMGAFGSAFAEAGQGGTLGIEPGGDVESALTKAGIFNDYSKGQLDIIKGANEAFIRPAAVALDTLYRGANAGMGAIGAGIQQASEEAFRNAPGILGEIPAFTEYALTTPAFMGANGIPHVVNEGRSVGAIGESEASYFSLKEPTPEQSIARQQAAEKIESPEQSIATVPEIKDIHTLAREVAPETFAKYDALDIQKNTLQIQLKDLATKRDEEFGENPPHAEEVKAVNTEIDNLLGKVKGIENKLTKRQATKLEDLRKQYDDLADKSQIASAQDTPDMAEIRSQIQQIDYAKRDMAVDVSAAYREAQNRMPEQEIPQEDEGIRSNTEVTANESAEVQKPIEQQLQNISNDVTEKLKAAGRSDEEASAASQLIAEHYRAVAEQGWAKGTPEEIYKRDSANIVAGSERQPQKIRQFAQGKELEQSVYHGSPYKFDKFSLDHIGNGEGEQVYGWGLYFASNKNIAEFYRESLASINKESGQLYEVNIPEDTEFLSWDKPLSEQPKEIKAKLEKEGFDSESTGKEIYNEISNKNSTQRTLLGNIISIKNDKAASSYLNSIGIKGIKYLDNTSRSVGEGSHNYVVFDDKDLETLRTFYQKARGKIHLATDDAKAAITLFKTADASTFIHETGHAWLDEMMRYAKAEDAPEGLLKDKDTVNNWLGVKEGEEISRTQHEKFARGFERYLMEGTAPSKALADVFAKFKKWLTDIYQTVSKLRSPITDDIRHVFDRLLSANPERTVIAPEIELPAETATPERELPAETAAPEVGGEDVTNVSTSEIAPTKSIESSTKGTQSPGKDIITPSNSEEINKITPEKQKNTVNNPNVKLEKPESKFVDKAGNIRLDNLNTLEDIKAVIRETANENDNFMGARRGKLSDGQILDLAYDLGINAEELSSRKLGQAFNAEQVIAARILLIQSATNLRELAMKVGGGGEADLTAYVKARARHIMIQSQVAGITAEAGRALRAFRQLEGGAQAKAIGQFLEENTGLDLFQLQQEAKQLSLLDTPQKVSKLINDAKKPTYKNMIIEYYINALISGPVTHLRYSVGNSLNALWTPIVEIPTAVAVSNIREAITKKVNPNRFYLGEAGAQLRGITEGSKNGLQAAAQAWKTGVSPLLPGEDSSSFIPIKTNAIPGTIGKALNVPTKSVSAIHSFFKSIRYEQNIQGLAYRNAMIEGLKEGTDAFKRRVAYLGTNPTEAMMESATTEALKELYMTPTDYVSAAGALSRFTNSNLAAKIIMPFMKIGSQITKNAFIERTPLGLLTQDIRDRAFYNEGVAAGDMQLAKMATGVALMGTLSSLTLAGLATGDGPTDPNKRAIWLLNNRPNSIQIGDITIPYQGLGHLGMLMRFSANMTEVASGLNEDESGKMASGFMESITRSVLDENFMRGVKDLLDAVYHSQQYGEKYIQQFATNWLPYSIGLGQVARLVDPSQREVHSIMESVQNKIPLLSEDLSPKRDRFGEIISNGTNKRYTNDPVVQRMESLQMGIGRLDKKIRGVQLTEQQYDDYSRIAGRLTKMRLNNYVSIPQTAALPPEIQMKTIHSIIDGSRETARSIIMMNNVNIVKQAYQNKVGALKGHNN